MKVVKWIAYSEITPDMKESVGGMGGWFGFDKHRDVNEKWTRSSDRWKDYVDSLYPKAIPYVEAIRESLLLENRTLTGEQHQQSNNGVPVFEDGTYGSYSWRGWGDIMAAIMSEKEDKDYTYMDFYM